jgi:hypothetical protein
VKKSQNAIEIFAGELSGSETNSDIAVQNLIQNLNFVAPASAFKRDFSKYLTFPTVAMPKVLHPLIDSASASIICPKDYIAIPLLTTLAGSIGRTYELLVKPGWYESTALWTVGVGKPGTAKSPGLKTAIKGVYEIQNRYIEEYQEQRKQYETGYKLYKKQLKKWERSGGGDGITLPAEPEKPIRRRTNVSDATVEALAPIMLDNPRGIMLIRDELAGWITSMNQYKGGKGSDVQFFLECWSGGLYSIDRKNLDVPVIIPHTYLTVGGTCQPEVLTALLSKSRQDDGFTARLLPYYPEDIEGVWSDEGISPTLYEPINKLYSKFSEFKMIEDEDGRKRPNVIAFTVSGKETFVNAIKAQKERQSKYNISGILESAWAKQPAHLARFSLVIHLIRFHSGETDSVDVDKESVLMAERLCLYFLAHIDKVWNQTEITANKKKPEKTVFEKLKNWSDNHNGEAITTRYLISSKYAKDKNEAINILDELEKRGQGKWLDEEKKRFKLSA